MKVVTASEAVAHVSSHSRVYVHEASMAPLSLTRALVERAAELRDVQVMHLHTEGEAGYVDAACDGHLRHNALFIGANVRQAIAEGRADFTPVFLSEVPGMIADGTLAVDTALVQVSPPDKHGYCRLGLSVACARAAVEHAKTVIAEINPQVPVTLGDSAIHVRQITAAVQVDRPLPQTPVGHFGEVERRIGEHIAALVPHGATLQMGIGDIPSAALVALAHHEDLGVHTEMFSDAIVDLVQQGVITNRHKTRFERRIVTSFAMGTTRLHEFVHNNPLVEFHPSDVVNDPNEIKKQHRMVSINSAIEIDLTGQVCADSIGTRMYSGIGGQMDFVQGALRCPGGLAIIALASTAQLPSGAVSRIVPQLKPGAGVVTTRGHVQWVVTEYGAVNLRGRSLRERAELLIRIAHPDMRAELHAAAVARKLFVSA